jgi:hypothetical protein
MEKLDRWIPLGGDFTVQGASVGCSECVSYMFNMEMASEALAILQIGTSTSYVPL